MYFYDPGDVINFFAVFDARQCLKSHYLLRLLKAMVHLTYQMYMKPPENCLNGLRVLRGAICAHQAPLRNRCCSPAYASDDWRHRSHLILVTGEVVPGRGVMDRKHGTCSVG